MRRATLPSANIRDERTALKYMHTIPDSDATEFREHERVNLKDLQLARPTGHHIA